MKRSGAEGWGTLGLALAGLAAVALVGFSPAGLLWGSVLTAVSGIAASAALLVWISFDDRAQTGRRTAWCWGLGAALILGLGSAADYFLWFSDARLWTVGCYMAAFLVLAVPGWKTGWAGGLRSALVAHLVATPVLLMLFWWNLGAPIQAAVFQANGLLDAYAASKVTLFDRWARDTFLFAVLPRTMIAMAAGLALGAGVGWGRERLERR